jgi:hypothetical protein
MGASNPPFPDAVSPNRALVAVAATLALGFAACSQTQATLVGTTTGGSSGSSSASGSSTGSSTTSGNSTSGTSTGTSTGTTTGTSTTGMGSTTGPGTQDTTTGTEAGGSVQLRLANFGVGMGSPIDLCYINNNELAAGWQGPLFAQGGEPLGVPYPGISGYEYVTGPIDITDVKVIPAPITDVTNACYDAGTIGNISFVGPDGGRLILGNNRSGTLALEGYGAAGNFKLAVYGYNDELSTNSLTDSIYRFINASPVAGTYDFGPGASNLLVTGAPFASWGNAATGAPSLDVAGYQAFTSDGGIYAFDVVQSGQIAVTINQGAMTGSNGYSFFFGTDQNSANAWAFFCNDSVSSAPYTFCYLPDGTMLQLTDGGF